MALKKTETTLSLIVRDSVFWFSLVDRDSNPLTFFFTIYTRGNPTGEGKSVSGLIQASIQVSLLANIKHPYKICRMLEQRLRRWADVCWVGIFTALPGECDNLTH